MAIAFVQAANAGTGAATGTIQGVTVTAVGAGGLIVGIVTWGTGTSGDLTSVTDNASGNTYTIVRRVVDATNGQCAASFYGYNIQNAPTVITANFGVTLGFKVISVMEFSGARTASAALDGTNEQGRLQPTTTAGTDAVDSGASTQTPSVNGCVCWSGSTCTSVNGTGSNAFTAGTNYTEPANAEHTASSEPMLSAEYEIQTTATARKGPFTTVNNGDYATFQMIFAPPGVGGGAATLGQIPGDNVRSGTFMSLRR